LNAVELLPMLLEETKIGWTPTTNSEKDAVWRQVDRLLADSSFSRSKRYPTLLRFMVSRTLDGDTDSLKERILGIEIFGRKPDYDSTQDPIVRVTAAELRKRIVRYYQDPEHEHELRFDLPAGSYIPQFRASADSATAVPLAAQEAVYPLRQGDSPKSVTLTFLSSRTAWLWLILGVCGLVIVAAALIFSKAYRQDAFDAFWQPLISSKQPIFICTADQPVVGNAMLIDAEHPVQPLFSNRIAHIMTADTLVPVVDLSGSLSSRGHANKVQPQGRTTFSDLGSSPVVLVGAFNNFWTLQFTKSLRFHFNNDPAFKHLWIEDSQDPTHRKWSVDTTVQDLSEDYALVARYREPSTRQWTVVVAGLGGKGNIAAIRFLLSREHMSELDNSAPRDWRSKNLEIILKTNLINGDAGPPQIEAVHTW